MLILAIDTALGACAAGVLDTASGVLVAHRSEAMTRGHAEALMPLLRDVMAQAAVGFARLDRIVATTGPGSFTGLRVGLAAARGIALAAAKPAVGVTTLTAYAAASISETGRDPVIAAIDARHGAVWYQVVSGNGASLVKPKLAPVAKVVEAARFGMPHLVGDAAGLIAAQWPSDVPPVSVTAQAAPDIAWVGWVGAAVDPMTSPARPTYLRAPDAKPQVSPLARAP